MKVNGVLVTKLSTGIFARIKAMAVLHGNIYVVRNNNVVKDKKLIKASIGSAINIIFLNDLLE
jgi:hypothetical protein